MSGWDLYQAWVGYQTAQHQAETSYARAVEVHGPYPDADLPESEAARQAEHDSDVAYEQYRDAAAEVRLDPDPDPVVGSWAGQGTTSSSADVQAAPDGQDLYVAGQRAEREPEAG